MESTGLTEQLLAFSQQLRDEGLSIGTAELLDAFAALGEISWQDEAVFREALATTLAKSAQDRRIFELVFDRFIFRSAETEAIKQQQAGTTSADLITDSGELDREALREQLQQAIRAGNQGAMRDLARLAIAAFTQRNETSGVLGVDVQRIRRALDLRPDPSAEEQDAEATPLSSQQVRAFEQILRRELERDTIQRSERLPPARPLNELDRALPTGPLQDLAAVQRIVMQLRRQLATQGHEQRGRRHHAQVDVRRTMRASLQTGGVPIELKYRPRRPRRPEIYVLCDVSTSVSSASVFFLSVLHALHETFRKLRSFVFIERVSEVTDIFDSERHFDTISEKIGSDAGVADRSGYTDYGRVWEEFFALVSDDLQPRSSIIVLGDARTNGRDARTDLFAQIAERAGRTFWLNPEPKLYWNYGDSVISTYGEYCELFECWTVSQLEEFVKALTRPVSYAA